MMTHPRLGEHGKPVTIKCPHTPTLPAAWNDPCAIATVVPDGSMPLMVNGVAIGPLGVPKPDRADWEQRARTMDFEEPPFDTEAKAPAAGAVVVEPDGRLWLVSPTNEFAQYKTTFPKGKSGDMSLKATALKEVFEEAGLQIELFGHLIDVTKTTSRTRFYLARRKGGDPAAMCWETQSVHLVPLEKAKDLLNQKVDHQVIDALAERWSSWASWFFRRDGDDPTWEAARSGQIPASRKDWPTLPLPARRTRISLDIRLDRREAENLKLGFVPRMMEQKWFAYFDGDTLYEHRSWTGFCISEVQFIPDGDGLRAVHADVNREPRQYENTDDAEDARLLTQRIRQLVHLTEDDRNAEDPFVAGLKASLVPNYLGDPRVVGNLLEPYFQAVLDHHTAKLEGKGANAAHDAYMKQNSALARIFSGDDPAYAVIGTWNTVGSLGSMAVTALDLDSANYADENLFCILSEGLAGVAIRLREMTTAFEADPEGEYELDLLPRIQELLRFTASVLMGTQAVVFPDRTMKDFQYVSRPRSKKVPGLFDADPFQDGMGADEAEEQKDEGKSTNDIEDLRVAFGLAPLNGVSTGVTGDPSDATSSKVGRPITLPGPIGVLAKKVGGVGFLAEELGVTARTVRRWATGGTIPTLPLKMLGRLLEKHQVDASGLTPDHTAE